MVQLMAQEKGGFLNIVVPGKPTYTLLYDVQVRIMVINEAGSYLYRGMHDHRVRT